MRKSFLLILLPFCFAGNAYSQADSLMNMLNDGAAPATVDGYWARQSGIPLVISVPVCFISVLATFPLLISLSPSVSVTQRTQTPSSCFQHSPPAYVRRHDINRPPPIRSFSSKFRIRGSNLTMK